MDSLFFILVAAVLAILAIVTLVLKHLIQWRTGINGVKERLDKLNEKQERLEIQLRSISGLIHEVLNEQCEGNQIAKLILRELEDSRKERAKETYLFEEIDPESNEERKE